MELPLGIVNLPMVKIITKKINFFVCLFQVCCKAVVLKSFTIGINSFKKITHKKKQQHRKQKETIGLNYKFIL